MATAKAKSSSTKKAKRKKVKKTVKKVAAPKRAVKKTSKRNLRKQLVYADGEQCFWTHRGTVLSTLKDLHRELDTMTDEEYQYHANADKNDFADWVEGVLCDETCADGLRRARRRATAHSCVKRCLTHYKR